MALRNPITDQNDLLPIEVWREWYPAAAKVPEMELKMERWNAADAANDESIAGIYALREWHAQPQGEAPDIIEAVSQHGRSWLLTREWRELPLEPFLDDAAKQHWRSVNVEATLREFRDLQGQFTGGFIVTIASDREVFFSLMRRQLEAKATELCALINKPMSDYTPLEIPERDDFEDISSKIVIDEQLARPFELREQLACFGPGFEVIRANMLDINPELNLPNIDLLNESLAIDLGAILRVFQEVDPKLKAILRNYAQHDYFQLEDPAAPDSFWWRHWKRESKKQAGKHSSRPSGHKPKRGERR